MWLLASVVSELELIILQSSLEIRYWGTDCTIFLDTMCRMIILSEAFSKLYGKWPSLKKRERRQTWNVLHLLGLETRKKGRDSRAQCSWEKECLLFKRELSNDPILERFLWSAKTGWIVRFIPHLLPSFLLSTLFHLALEALPAPSSPGRLRWPD